MLFMLKEADLFQLAQYVITKDFPDIIGCTIFSARISVYLPACTSTLLLIVIVLDSSIENMFFGTDK